MSAPIFATNAFAPHNFPARIQATERTAAFTSLQREKSRGPDFSTSLRISTVKRHECRAPSISRIRRATSPCAAHRAWCSLRPPACVQPRDSDFQTKVRQTQLLFPLYMVAVTEINTLSLHDALPILDECADFRNKRFCSSQLPSAD